MKRSREEQIMFGAFQRVGYEVTADIGKAIVDGLRQIRREKYEERMEQRAETKGKTPGLTAQDSA